MRRIFTGARDSILGATFFVLLKEANRELRSDLRLWSTVALALVATHAYGATDTWIVHRSASSFERAAFAGAQDELKVRSSGNLGGAPSDCCVTGWVEYDLVVPEAGWHSISVEGSAAGVQFFVRSAEGGKLENVGYGGVGNGGVEDRVTNAWLSRGTNTIRLQALFWTGFPKLSTLIVRRSNGRIGDSISAKLSHSMVRQDGQCPIVTIFAGGAGHSVSVGLKVNESLGQGPITSTVTFPPSPNQLRRDLTLPCDRAGFFYVSFVSDGADIPASIVRPLNYEVVDSSGTKHRSGGFVNGMPVLEIDLSSKPPDFQGGGAARAINGTLSYRQSGDSGFTKYQRVPSAIRAGMRAPSWFAYELRGLRIQTPHLVTIDFPDDALMTMPVSLRESIPRSYPVSAGVDSGGEFLRTGETQSLSMLFWPRADNPRVVFTTAHDGRRAAAARVRVHRLQYPLSPLVERSAGREVINWYEEGDNFRSIYGAPDVPTTGWRIAVDRWVNAARASGITTLVPTVLVYEFALYPSDFNVAFSRPDVDVLRRIVLVAEAHGLYVIPELHPRADELTFRLTATDTKPHLLRSKGGESNYYQSGGKTRTIPPHFSPIHPTNQDWYIGMIGELADNYKDSPALTGVSLRLMQWANPTLNNFHSLDWGYDDYTVGLFSKETGIGLPVRAESQKGQEGPNARARYAWLMANAREAWIDWRCRKIAELYTRIRDRVRQARPDLKVYSTVFNWSPASDRATLREAGIDPVLLGQIDGVVLVNALGAYGRREADPVQTQKLRDNLLDPSSLNMMRADRPGAFLTGASYVESTEIIVTPEELGFPAGTKRTWTSAAVNPAGRHILERYAVQLAETDANIIGDGGNGYSLGQAETREWLKEYLSLPTEPFTPRADARDPVAVWERSASDGALYFYAVNRERYEANVLIQTAGAQEAFRLLDGTSVPGGARPLRLRLRPYELMGLRLPPGGRITSVVAEVPQAERDHVKTLVSWIADLANSTPSIIPGSGLNAQDVAILKSAHREAATALAAGHLWRARTRLEHHTLIAIYEKLGKYPPGLRDLGTANDIKPLRSSR